LADYETLAIPPELMLRSEAFTLYRCYGDQGHLLYVGSTGQLGRRLVSHMGKVWFQQVRGITLEWYADELAARNAERRAIHVENPKYNVQGKNAPDVPPPAPMRRNPEAPPAATRPSFTYAENVERARKAERSARRRLTSNEMARTLHVSKTTACAVLREIHQGQP
jgi:hypothetical protein